MAPSIMTLTGAPLDAPPLVEPPPDAEPPELFEPHPATRVAIPAAATIAYENLGFFRAIMVLSVGGLR